MAQINYSTASGTSSWHTAQVYVWNGTSWVSSDVGAWDGSAWNSVSSGGGGGGGGGGGSGPMPVVLSSHLVYSYVTWPGTATSSITYVNTAYSGHPAGSVVTTSTGDTSSSTIYTDEWNPTADSASNYQIQVTIASSTSENGAPVTSLTGNQPGTWYNLGSAPSTTFALSVTAGPHADRYREVNLTVTIRRISDSATVSTTDVILQVESASQYSNL